MVVGCPKCKTRLKIADEKIKPEGIKIKCPKCATVLRVRKPGSAPAAAPKPAPAAAKPAAPAAPKPAAPVAKPAAPAAPKPAAPAKPVTPHAPSEAQPVEAMAQKVNTKKILVAHQDAAVVQMIMEELLKEGYLIIPVQNGTDAVAQATKELPFILMLDAALPHKNGYDVGKQLREAERTSELRVIIIASKMDMNRQRLEPEDAPWVDAYLYDDTLDTELPGVITEALSKKHPKIQPKPAAPAPKPAAPVAAPAAPKPAAPKPAAPAAQPEMTPVDRDIIKAKRLARTVLSDIDLYSPEKVIESIKTGQFQAVFAEELREGLKHYQNRIAADVRNKGNFFQEAIDEFIDKKKKIIGLS